MKNLIIAVLFIPVLTMTGYTQPQFRFDENNDIYLVNLSANINHIFTIEDIPNYSAAGPKITVKGKLHRKIENRPRDGKECKCKDCFGVCDFSVEVSYEFRSIVIQPTNTVVGDNQSTIYFLDAPDNAEEEFGIDEDISVPSLALAGTGISALTLKAGIYQYNNSTINIEINGNTVVSYGYVVVNSLIQ